MWLLILMLLSFGVAAQPNFEQIQKENMGWKISTRPEADDRPITLCQFTLYELTQGERVHLEGWAQVDATGEIVGVNLQIAYCDDMEPECNYSGRRWPENSGHSWAAGNVSRSEEHHKTMRPLADYVSPMDQSAVTFKLFVNVYGRAGRIAEVDDCRLTAERR